MTALRNFKYPSHLILAFLLSANTYAAVTDISTTPLATYVASTSTDVKPNLMYILDDSGSMGWDYMPDWANDNSPPTYLYKNNAFNGVAYNPATTYSPPVSSYTQNSDLSYNVIYYPSMDGTTTSRGADSTAKPNWKAVPNDGFGIQSTTTSNLVNNAYSWTTVPGEYCTTPHMTSCQVGSSSTYLIPANLRWCTSSGLTNCKALWSSTNTFWRTPTPRTATIAVSGSSSTSVSNITVGGISILSATISASTSASSIANSIVTNINACSKTITGICGISGYSASTPVFDGTSTYTITISAPGTTSSTPVVTQSGSMSITPTTFAAGTVSGENLRTNITSTTTSYPYPGTSAKAPTRTDCAGATCTYNEEMTNYANWWAYYHTRMQMMKSASSRAFSALSDRFRVGYMSINNNTGSDFQNISDFSLSQRNAWNSKLINASPSNSTPLRVALSNAGRLYGGMLNSTSFNGVTVTDPVQYSCQQNYTILSTDGFWNGGAGFKLNGTTAVGNQDGSMARPYNDGATSSIQKRTSQLQQRTGQLQSSTSSLQQQISQLQTQTSTLQKQTSQLQARTSQLQTRTYQLQTRTSANSGSTWTGWSNTTSCTWDNSGSSRRGCQYLAVSAWSDAASCTPAANGTGTSGTWSTGVECQYLPWTVYSDAASCTALAQDTTGTWSVGVATQCQTVVATPYVDATSCNASSTPNGSGITTQCQYVDGSWVGAASCTAVPKSTSPNYTVASSRQCQTVITQPYANAATCTTSSTPDAGGYTTACQYTAWTTAANVASCTDLPRSTSSPYTVGTATVCSVLSTSWSGWSNVASCTASLANQCQYTGWSSWGNVSACTALAQSTSPNYSVGVAAECQTLTSGGTSDTLADVAAYYYNTDLRTSNCTGPIIAPATTPTDLCTNNVPPNGLDIAASQHMTTFTLGLGAPGSMLFSPTYWTDTSGDFYDVLQGNSAVTASGVCSWQANGTTCNWPTPASDSVNNIDDLWHAAINGRGDYFSATSPDNLASSLSGMLSKIVNVPLPGTAAAAASSNPNISSTDNYVFSSSYVSVDWYGELIRQQIDAVTGALTAPQWSAMTMLDCAMAPAWIASHTYFAGDTFIYSSRCYVVLTPYSSGASFDTTVDFANSTRITMTALPTTPTIYTKGSSGITPFTWTNLTTAQKAYFSTPYITYVAGSTATNYTGLSQFCASGASCLSSGDQVLAEGANLVSFLGGVRTNEGTYYRQRKHVLGDIVASEARYVQTPLFNYNDSGYSGFKTLKASRSGTVYVAANDGMLHAFNAATGAEIWGYIPELVLPNLYKLADKNYSASGIHQYYVDNSPEVGDVCPSAPSSTCADNQWKTIIVGGLNRGGKGYYALDVTDPANPVVLWEFTDANMGYSYGNPRITKLKNGTWVVMLTSGYNNADGVGHLYVLNAYTGALMTSIGINGIISTTGSPTPGTATNPSGLARISAHVLHPSTDNTVQQVYGGDLNGDLWRFDVNNDIGASGYDAQLLVSYKDASGNAQPITAKPTVTSVNSVPVIYVGTGRYLGVTDVGSTTNQSFYAFVDRLGATTIGNPRTSSNGFVQQILVSNSCPANSTFCTPGQTVRTIANPATVNLSTGNGWFIDFLTGGERSSTDPALGLGTLLFTTITPQTTNGSPCGAASSDASSSYFYALNYLTGAGVVGAEGAVANSLGNGIATRPVMVEMPNGTIKALIRVSGGGSGGGSSSMLPPIATAGSESTGAGSETGSSTRIDEPPVDPSSSGVTRRVSWRELVTE